jgi:hypothetical protein
MNYSQQPEIGNPVACERVLPGIIPSRSSIRVQGGVLAGVSLRSISVIITPANGRRQGFGST